MTIEVNDADFPNNAVELLKLRAPAAIDPDIFVIGRPVRDTDPRQTVGIYATLWTPNEDSYEFIGGPLDPKSPHAPTLQNYNITLQAMIKDADTERGLAVHSVLAKRVRSMLYYDRPLRVGFTALASSSQGVTERLKRWGIRSQRFNSNEIDGDWFFLSVLDLWIETETV